MAQSGVLHGRPAPPPIFSWRGLPELACLVVATALSTGLVLYDLGKRSLWIDEGTTWGTASQHGATLWYWLLHDGGNMLGYYAAMHVLIPIIGSTPFALRLPAALCVPATVPCGFFLLRRLFDSKAAVAGGFLLAASAPIVYWGQEARGYTPAIFFVTAAALALSIAVLDKKRWAWIAFVAAATIAAYMILLAALAVLALLVSLVAVRRRELELRRVGISIATLLALWVPLGVAAVRRGSGQLDWIRAAAGDTYRQLGLLVVSSQANGVVGILTVSACALGLGVLVHRLVRHGRSLDAFPPALLLAWVVIPIGVLLLISAVDQPVLSDRYLLPVVPAASLLAAAGITRLKPAPVALGLAAALVVVRTMEVMPAYGSNVEDWVSTVNYVVANLKPHDCTAFYVADGFTTFDYYYLRLGEPHKAVPVPEVPPTTWDSRSPYVLDPQTIPPARMKQVAAGCSRLWVVYTHSGGAPAGPGVPLYQAYKYRQSQYFASELENAGFVLQQTTHFISVRVVLYVHVPGKHASAPAPGLPVGP